MQQACCDLAPLAVLRNHSRILKLFRLYTMPGFRLQLFDATTDPKPFLAAHCS